MFLRLMFVLYLPSETYISRCSVDWLHMVCIQTSILAVIITSYVTWSKSNDLSNLTWASYFSIGLDLVTTSSRFPPLFFIVNHEFNPNTNPCMSNSDLSICKEVRSPWVQSRLFTSRFLVLLSGCTFAVLKCVPPT